MQQQLDISVDSILAKRCQENENRVKLLDCTYMYIILPNFSPGAPTDCSIGVFDIIGTRTRRVLLPKALDQEPSFQSPAEPLMACVECQPARCLARAKEYLRPVFWLDRV